MSVHSNARSGLADTMNEKTKAANAHSVLRGDLHVHKSICGQRKNRMDLFVKRSPKKEELQEALEQKQQLNWCMKGTKK